KNVISDGAIAGGIDHHRQLLLRKRIDRRHQSLELIAKCLNDLRQRRKFCISCGSALGVEELNPTAGKLSRLAGGGGDGEYLDNPKRMARMPDDAVIQTWRHEVRLFVAHAVKDPKRLPAHFPSQQFKRFVRHYS